MRRGQYDGRSQSQPRIPQRSMPSGSAPKYPNVASPDLISTPGFSRPARNGMQYQGGDTTSVGQGTRGVKVGVSDFNNPHNAGRFGGAKPGAGEYDRGRQGDDGD